MRDFGRLREYLRVAIAAAPLVAVGCSNDSSRRRLPTCPSGDWCGPAADIAHLAPPEPPGEALGCLKSVTNGKYSADEPDKPVPATWPGGPNERLHMTLDEVATRAKRDAGDATTCCYRWIEPCPGGRPLVVDGRPTYAKPQLRSVSAVSGQREASCFASARPDEPQRSPAFSASALSSALADSASSGEREDAPGSTGETTLAVESTDTAIATGDVTAALHAQLADAWLADALAEHASVASFARTALELLAVGAPPALLDHVARAMRDELRHAELCFDLAARYSGHLHEAGPLAAAMPRAANLAQLARDTFLEGCVDETIAALVVTRALAACTDPVVATALREIVDDETRHAALAWQTLAWAISAGGAPVIAAIHDAARDRAPSSSPQSSGSRDPRLAAHGRLDGDALLAARHDAWHQVILPTLAQLTAART